MSLFDSFNKNQASATKWKRHAPGWYIADWDGVEIQLRHYGLKRPPAAKFNGGEWQKLWAGSLDDAKSQAIRIAARLLAKLDDTSPA